MPSGWAKLCGVLRRELWRRNIPHGMISWRYLFASSPQLAAHREIFWTALPGLPKPLYLILEIILWLKWATLYGWLALFRVLRRYGGLVRDERGIPVYRQFFRLVRLSIGACMPPADVYRFGLVEHPGCLWNFVSDRHIAAFHRWRNSRQPISSHEYSRLGNKAVTTGILLSRGIPMAPILATVSSTASLDFLDALNAHRHLFCKSRSGNRGLGAFECWQTEQTIEGRMFEGEALPDQQSVIAAWESLLERDHALVQPALQNHPQLAPLVPDGRAITVRCITFQDGRDIAIMCASLEIPAERKPSDRPDTYVILPVDADSGLVQPLAGNLPLPEPVRQSQRDMLKAIGGPRPLPDWQALIGHSLSAHGAFSEFWAIAWDWVLTPDGPILLEGNTGFGGSLPQSLTGGFLAQL
ncbi:sugar-transfer associated ATP-grasp domain-containing protein [uncultured Parasphingorhabdus sp.]|uniref:sugar-transfer associated ATP-grasp domain-containing protein n=1 Tax=uncultured Parasphingorhabdus sp. TaxID=2709694 RepID=UPI002AA65734|nr:sugar-transfer associated ATP-grasp domain-containing protein [uncultured Parasphingorhabdus sp.]